MNLNLQVYKATFPCEEGKRRWENSGEGKGGDRNALSICCCVNNASAVPRKYLTALVLRNSATFYSAATGCSWSGTGLVRPSLWVRPRQKLVDFHDAKNRQRPCRMIIRDVKDPQSTRLAMVLSTKLNSLHNSASS
ncbi:hypothetical protein TNCV_4702651 [Trichonephila clavipes]|nr:hypothetical protein TNCV_4702651 [Trichonephila clavipes]